MSEKFQIVWTEKAVNDLLEIKKFISQDSLARAEIWLLKLYESADNLTTFPNRGRVVPEFENEFIREIIVEKYRIVYRIKEPFIEIMTVFEGHRKFTDHNK